jgi:hypothetical protein
LEFAVKGDFAEAAVEVLAEVGVDTRFLGGDAALDSEESDLGKEIVDFLGSGESAGGFSEFGGGEVVSSGRGIGFGLVGQAVG